MKFIIIFNLFVSTTINHFINAHENHDHKIYNWSNSANKTIKFDNTYDVEAFEDKRNKKTNNESSWTKIFRR